MIDIKCRELEFNLFKSTTPILDANCWIPMKHELKEMLSNDMQSPEFIQDAIHKPCILSHKQCLITSPSDGNLALTSLISAMSDVFGAAILAPEISFFPSNEIQIMDYYLQNKIVLFRFYPQTLHHSMKKWQIGHILDYMQNKQIPLMISHTELSYDSLAELLEEYPLLPIILDGGDKKLLYHTRVIISLLKKYPNLYLETHGATQFMLCEYLINTLQIDRLIYGSNFPYNDPDPILYMLYSANISKIQKENILYKNMTTLINNIKL